MSRSSTMNLRIGYVPEHYLLPLHLSKPLLTTEFRSVDLVPFPAGTGHMISALRSDEIDLAVGLTEGWVAGLLTSEGRRLKGYEIVGSWVENPLRWAVVTGRNRERLETVSDLVDFRRLGVSRLGSGSHVMGFVLGRREGWIGGNTTSSEKGLTVVPLGPFKELRDGVNDQPGGTGAKADFFMWEHFTTKPYWLTQKAELKHLGEIYTPWPSWHVAASSTSFPDPRNDERLMRVFECFDEGIQKFNLNPDDGVRMLGTGELGCHYSEEDAREWLKSVKFFTGTRGVSENVMERVVTVLKDAGVIESSVSIEEGDGVVGISRGREP